MLREHFHHQASHWHIFFQKRYQQKFRGINLNCSCNICGIVEMSSRTVRKPKTEWSINSTCADKIVFIGKLPIALVNYFFSNSSQEIKTIEALLLETTRYYPNAYAPTSFQNYLVILTHAETFDSSHTNATMKLIILTWAFGYTS